MKTQSNLCRHGLGGGGKKERENSGCALVKEGIQTEEGVTGRRGQRFLLLNHLKVKWPSNHCRNSFVASLC